MEEKSMTDTLDSALELLGPVPRPSSGPFTIRIKPEVAEVVLVDNGKPNSMVILRRAQRALRDRGIAVKEEIRVKPFAGGPMSEQLLAELSQEKGLVLCGINDCGSCSMGGALDSVLLQRAGVAGFTILTVPFQQRVKDITAYQETNRSLPPIVLTHPMQNISDAELDERATELADAAERMLGGSDPH
jgi:hypothetical protein